MQQPVAERRAPERRMEPTAGVALLQLVRQQGAARVVVSDQGTNLEPDLLPGLQDALRQVFERDLRDMWGRLTIETSELEEALRGGLPPEVPA